METWKLYNNIFKVLKGKNWWFRILYLENLRVLAGTYVWESDVHSGRIEGLKSV